jgi:hypothetical protein
MHARDLPPVNNGHGWLDILEMGEPDSEAMIAPEARHALAALCLAGQSYGFSRSDVAIFSMLLDGYPLDANPAYTVLHCALSPEQMTRVRALRDNMIALLPPPDPSS